jgi:hypothetical protein
VIRGFRRLHRVVVPEVLLIEAAPTRLRVNAYILFSDSYQNETYNQQYRAPEKSVPRQVEWPEPPVGGAVPIPKVDARKRAH